MIQRDQHLYHEMLGRKKAIIWDWNGTLLDDTALCISCMNDLLAKRKLPLLDRIRYREIFTFPVKDYYLRAGFDFSKEQFEIPALEFISLYYKRLSQAILYPEASSLLTKLRKRGFVQAILSAMEHDSLENSLKEKGIDRFFDMITGINDHYAHSKLDIGKELIRKLGFPPEQIILIGDTLHDLEVAQGLGVDVLLIANGHQSGGRLLQETSGVIENLGELSRLFDKAI
ncbi:MAG: HAD family hydrolase [bacterium]